MNISIKNQDPKREIYSDITLLQGAPHNHFPILDDPISIPSSRQLMGQIVDLLDEYKAKCKSVISKEEKAKSKNLLRKKIHDLLQLPPAEQAPLYLDDIDSSRKPYRYDELNDIIDELIGQFLEKEPAWKVSDIPGTYSINYQHREFNFSSSSGKITSFFRLGMRLGDIICRSFRIFYTAPLELQNLVCLIIDLLDGRKNLI